MLLLNSGNPITKRGFMNKTPCNKQKTKGKRTIKTRFIRQCEDFEVTRLTGSTVLRANCCVGTRKLSQRVPGEQALICAGTSETAAVKEPLAQH